MKLVELVVDEVERQVVGNDLDGDTTIGALISPDVVRFYTDETVYIERWPDA